MLPLPLILLLVGCATSNVDSIIKNGDPTFMNVTKVNDGAYTFINKDKLYVLTNDEGLDNKAELVPEDKSIILTMPQKSSTNEKEAHIFIGTKTGTTKAQIKQADGTTTNFTITVK